MKKFVKNLLIIMATTLLFSCAKQSNSQKSIAVFVPGIMDDSPTYAKLANGVKQAVEEYNANKDENSKCNLFIMEAGTNQAEWSNKLLGVILENYRLIVTVFVCLATGKQQCA